MEIIHAYLYNIEPLCKVAATQKVEEVSIPVFLPHELLHASVKAGPEQAPALCKDGVFDSSGLHVLDVKPQKLSIREQHLFTSGIFQTLPDGKITAWGLGPIRDHSVLETPHDLRGMVFTPGSQR